MHFHAFSWNISPKIIKGNLFDLKSLLFVVHIKEMYFFKQHFRVSPGFFKASTTSWQWADGISVGVFTCRSIDLRLISNKRRPTVPTSFLHFVYSHAREAVKWPNFSSSTFLRRYARVIAVTLSTTKLRYYVSQIICFADAFQEQRCFLFASDFSASWWTKGCPSHVPEESRSWTSGHFVDWSRGMILFYIFPSFLIIIHMCCTVFRIIFSQRLRQRLRQRYQLRLSATYCTFQAQLDGTFRVAHEFFEKW